MTCSSFSLARIAKGKDQALDLPETVGFILGVLRDAELRHTGHALKFSKDSHAALHWCGQKANTNCAAFARVSTVVVDTCARTAPTSRRVQSKSLQLKNPPREKPTRKEPSNAP